mgnify:CR=1 FL=1
MNNIKKSNILVCITGSIAAYKSVDLVRLLKKNDHQVQVVMTDSAKEFITPLTLQAISGNKVHQNLLDMDAELAMGHIELAKWADVIVIAPCSAETIARLSLGRANDLLGAIILASKAKKFIAPAMNTNMWSNPVTKKNIFYLSSNDMNLIGPAKGDQACGDVGYGRMSEPEEIYESVQVTLNQSLNGKKIIVTAGPTREQIDPVRFISNNSSGKMGFAMAEAAASSGAEVFLITGPVSLTCSDLIKRIDVKTANDMYEESLKLMHSADIFIGCAAVADFKSVEINDQKIKKSFENHFDIRLEKNIDIISSLAEQFPAKTFMGFCAETERVEEYAKEKLISKGLDLIVANDVSKSDIGFDSDFNEVNVYTKEEKKYFQKSTKSLLAIKLINLLGPDSQSIH